LSENTPNVLDFNATINVNQDNQMHSISPSQEAIKKLTLYDTYRRDKFEFTPLSEQSVSLYACGPTVYDYAHIGNLRSYVFVDILRRALEINGYQVNHVMNITDVGHLTSDADSGEDKMAKGSRKQGKTAWQIAQYFEEAFIKDLALLGIKQPTTLCRATDHIAEQIEYIQALQDNGFTYVTEDGVYFDSSKLDSYGYIARLNIQGQRAGERVDIGDKKNITDFALWKFSAISQHTDNIKRQMQWQSPWGIGFPGWHIECSAMSEKYLGKRFDIHVGGEDHIPVHHTNEIAQCEGRHGHQPANFWMHGYFLQLGKQKISKSGQSMLLSSLMDKGYDPLAYRYLLLTSHYRSKLQFSFKALASAATALKRLRELLAGWPDQGDVLSEYKIAFLNYLNDDLKVPQALALIWEVVKSELPTANKKATILYFDQIFALSLTREVIPVDIPQSVIALAERRQLARVNKDWPLSDSLRQQIGQLGFTIKDKPHGYDIQ
jgi:cysteinyl-tRNA synthetase